MTPAPDYLGNEHHRKILKKTGLPQITAEATASQERLPARIESRRRIASLGNVLEGLQRNLISKYWQTLLDPAASIARRAELL